MIAGVPKFSIITPTILRTTAHRTMRSVDEQTSTDYEHIVIVDGLEDPVPFAWVANPRRYIARCHERHNDCGATCRGEAIRRYARGIFVLYLDDDDYYIPTAIETLARLVQDGPAQKPFGVFSVMLGGVPRLDLPPGECRTPTCGMYHRRQVGGETLTPPAPQRHYAEDSRWAGELAKRFGYDVIRCPSLAIVERGHNSSDLPGGPPRTELPSVWDQAASERESHG